MGRSALTRVNPAAWGPLGWAGVARPPRSLRTQNSQGAAPRLSWLPGLSYRGCDPVGNASSHPQRGLVPWTGGSPSPPPPGFANANKRQGALQVGGDIRGSARGPALTARTDGTHPLRAPGSAPAHVRKSSQIGELPHYECFSLSKEQPILTRAFLQTRSCWRRWGWGGLRSDLGTLPPGEARAVQEPQACAPGWDAAVARGSGVLFFVLFCFVSERGVFLFSRVLS